jgi:hypothetical protein
MSEPPNIEREILGTLTPLPQAVEGNPDVVEGKFGELRKLSVARRQRE